MDYEQVRVIAIAGTATMTASLISGCGGFRLTKAERSGQKGSRRKEGRSASGKISGNSYNTSGKNESECEIRKNVV